MCWSPCSAGRRCLRRRAEPVQRASWKVCLETTALVLAGGRRRVLEGLLRNNGPCARRWEETRTVISTFLRHRPRGAEDLGL